MSKRRDVRASVAALLLGSAVLWGGTANAATLIDFTDETVWPSPTTSHNYGGGVSVSVTPTGGALTYNNPTDSPGGAGSCEAAGVLACDQDGLGVRDDEVTFDAESVLLTFANPVNVSELYFLDLFKGPPGDTARTGEVAMVQVNGGSIFSYAAVAALATAGGYASFPVSLLGVTTLKFFPGSGRDDDTADFALAGLRVSPVPVPAALPLLLTGLAGLGYLGRRRRNKQAA